MRVEDVTKPCSLTPTYMSICPRWASRGRSKSHSKTTESTRFRGDKKKRPPSGTSLGFLGETNSAVFSQGVSCETLHTVPEECGKTALPIQKQKTAPIRVYFTNGKSPDGSNRQEWIAVRNKAIILCGPAGLGEYVTGYWGWGGDDEKYTWKHRTFLRP